MKKLIQNGKIILVLGLVGLVATLGFAIFRYVHPQTSRSYTSQEIAQMKIERVNINTADTITLATIPGLTEAQAQSIVAYREEHGGFTDTKQLLNIKGIGQKTYIKIVAYITTE